jgi:hypothetical protein
MGGLFSSPKMPAPAPAPAAPTNKDASIAQAQQEDQIRRQAAGRSSTMLTGGQGLGDLGTVSRTSGMLGGS